MSQTFTAIDLFAGAGGATQGLTDAGFEVLGAVELDPIAAETYRLNHPRVRVWQTDIRTLPATQVRNELQLEPGELTLLKACPPCQGFSTLAEGRMDGRRDDRNDLVGHTVRFVRALRPMSVLLENVPGLGRDHRSADLMSALAIMGYAVKSYVVDATDFDVPQRRKRFIILALRGKNKVLPAKLSPADLVSPKSVREAFEELEQSIDPTDPLHVPRPTSQLVEERIAAIPLGGNRFDLPEHLQLACHKNLPAGSQRSAAGSYGRLRLDDPAPTMTTRCTTPACGSFIHPTLDRAITLREAAAIQTFPATYQFAGKHGDIERQIGNAVPVKMARGIALSLVASLGLKK
ncbi:DNA cytosine methyltransferase [Subtercola endophyticus]|nr:DNA cytosine methyltransferase [Subtercola endophyticus]